MEMVRTQPYSYKLHNNPLIYNSDNPAVRASMTYDYGMHQSGYVPLHGSVLSLSYKSTVHRFNYTTTCMSESLLYSSGRPTRARETSVVTPTDTGQLRLMVKPARNPLWSSGLISETSTKTHVHSEAAQLHLLPEKPLCTDS